LLLDNHSTRFTETKEELKAIMDGMADFLGIIILSLQSIAQTLGFEVNQFKDENIKLASQVDEFSLQNGELKTQLTLFSDETKQLTDLNVSIKGNSEKLESLVSNQADLLQKNQRIQGEMKAEYANNLSIMQTQVIELTQIKDDMTKELESAHSVTKALMDCNEEAVNINMEYDKSREEFINETQGHFDRKNKKLGVVIDVFSGAVNDMQNTAELLKHSVEETGKLNYVFTQALAWQGIFSSQKTSIELNAENTSVLINQ
jgi:hypothetical protein